MNTISIILPTYNGAEYIKKSIQSCVDQSYPHWELIIVDDCSSDNTPEIIEEYSDPRIHVVRHGANLKLPEALNSGFARSQGDYLTWTSDDNMYAPKALETLLNFLQNNPEISLVYSDYERIDHLGQVIDYYSAPSPEFLSEFNVVGACFLYRRTVYEKIGEYDPSMVLAEDYDYWLRVNNHFKLAALNLPLYYYREHPYTLTNIFGIEKQQLMTEIAREKWIGPSPYFYPSRVSRSISRRYLDFAFDAYKIKNWDLVRKFIVRAIKHDYRWLRNYGVVSLSVRAFIPYLREKMEDQ